jgi:CHAT domain-containing protein
MYCSNARLFRGLGLIVLALSAVCFAGASAQAQAPRKGAAQRTLLGWDGRAVTRTCNAEQDNLQGLKAALIEHEKARIGFRNKLRHGVFTSGELSGGRIKTASPASLLDIATRRLSELGAGGETLALLYDIGLSNGQYALCVWLLSASGVEAAATVRMTEQSPLRQSSAASVVRRGLDVEGRAAARAPRLHRSAGAEATASTRAAPAQLGEAWSLLMPGPIASKLAASKARRLLILPVSDVGFAPFAALPLGTESLIDRFALVLLPDVEALLGVSSGAIDLGERRAPRSVVIGDPAFSGDQHWRFPPLEGARAEAIEVARMVGGRPLLREEATRRRVIDELRDNRDTALIYIATHAISDAVNPMDGSFLALAEGHLYGRDIKDLFFGNNPLVVMSACQTGLGKVFEGGTFGLVRAWYHAGAPQIVMSLWNIDDDATKDLMLAFMQRTGAGAMTEFALREAMLETRPRHADPALWASVALFGLPSPPQRPSERRARSVSPVPPRDAVAPSVLPDGQSQRAFFYMEDPQDPSPRRLTGSVTWRKAIVPGPGREDAEVRAEITVPERQLTLALSLRRNSEPALPASHVIELSFAMPAETEGGVQAVPGILAKDQEETRGRTIPSMSVRLPSGSFVLGLTGGDAALNQSLLRNARWFDIPIVFASGRRAILAIEQGAGGERAFSETFAAWSAQP